MTKIKSYVITCKGPRPYMEDTFVITKVAKNMEVLGVFDGHGGTKISQICRDAFPSIFFECFRNAGNDVNVALRRAFFSIDNSLEVKKHPDEGSTIAVVIVYKNKLWFANAGDSMSMVIEQNGSSLMMSYEHKVSDPKETNRIKNQGGLITYWDGMARINGTLNLSRSIGDHYIKQYVLSEPFVHSHPITNVQYIVTASDGIWDVYDQATLTQDVLRLCAIHNIERVLEIITENAYRRGSTDNITLMISNVQIV